MLFCCIFDVKHICLKYKPQVLILWFCYPLHYKFLKAHSFWVYFHVEYKCDLYFPIETLDVDSHPLLV